MLTTLEEITKRLVERYDPDRIILFGSRATGGSRPDSDVDLLIVKETPKRPIDRRCEVGMILADRNLALDIEVLTPEEMWRLLSVGSPFLREVLETGRVLYMRKATESWLRDAEEELTAASMLLEREVFRPACYHGQQCVEKTLKALVLEKGGSPDRTHDIAKLLNGVESFGWGSILSMDDAVFIDSIYRGRYPTEAGLLPHGEPSRDNAVRAVAVARAVYERARNLLGLS
ncbi:MAG: HEPN domain-containing protein [Nitrospirae bacterium]|nr:HEPN domain-containing protein [Nitrospirota bacterium]